MVSQEVKKLAGMLPGHLVLECLIPLCRSQGLIIALEKYGEKKQEVAEQLRFRGYCLVQFLELWMSVSIQDNH